MASLERWGSGREGKKRDEVKKKSKMVQAGLERLGLLVENS